MLIISIILVRSLHTELETAAVNRQTILAKSSGQRFNDLLETKINSVITQSQDTDIINLDGDKAKVKLLQYVNQDSDILGLTLADNTGRVKVAIRNSQISLELGNLRSTEAFKVVTQRSNEVSIGEISYDSGNPTMQVVVPLISFGKLGDKNLTSTEAVVRRFGSDITGLMVVEYSLSNIWGSILRGAPGTSGSSYIVNAAGKLIAHPDSGRAKSNPDLKNVGQVAKFLDSPKAFGVPTFTQSPDNTEVLSAHYPIARTGWAVITQEPQATIFAPSNKIAQLATSVFLLATIASIIVSLLFSRNLTRPILSLVAGTSRISEGDLDHQIQVRSNDEIGVLAQRFNDMTSNLKQTISKFRTESTKLNIVLNSVGEGIIAVDNENRIVLANMSAAVLAGKLPTDINGQHFDEVFTLSKNNEPFKINPGSTEVYKDVAYISPSKRIHYIDIFANRVEDDPDGIESIITMRDQTDERDLELMKLDFVSMAAHELRTPITAIRGYLGLILEEKSLMSEKGCESVERAQSSTKQLVGLVSNLLNVSKIENGKLNMIFTKLDWAKAVSSAIGDHKFTADENNIKLSYDGPEDNVWIMADEIAIKEVINNLIANSIHYTAKDGAVVVSMIVQDNEVITHVQDNGIGISPYGMKHLFTKFYRVKGGIASGSGGTGLGLYISKSVVELHNGRIWVESEEGKGSDFAFSLPSYDEVQYEKLTSKQVTGVNKRRGWITKNTTR